MFTYGSCEHYQDQDAEQNLPNALSDSIFFSRDDGYFDFCHNKLVWPLPELHLMTRSK